MVLIGFWKAKALCLCVQIAFIFLCQHHWLPLKQLLNHDGTKSLESQTNETPMDELVALYGSCVMSCLTTLKWFLHSDTR